MKISYRQRTYETRGDDLICQIKPWEDGDKELRIDTDHLAFWELVRELAKANHDNDMIGDEFKPGLETIIQGIDQMLEKKWF